MKPRLKDQKERPRYVAERDIGNDIKENGPDTILYTDKEKLVLQFLEVTKNCFVYCRCL